MNNKVTALEVQKPKTDLIQNVGDLQKLGHIFMASHLFQDTASEAQAVVKIMAGQELGMSPFASMAGIDIIKGKVAIKPILLAAKLKQSKVYNYRVIENSDIVCRIEFYEHGQLIGTSTFDTEDAKRLGLLDKYNWKAQPATMRFWRAMSQGIRMFCPDLYAAPVYTEEEIEDAMRANLPKPPKKAEVTPTAAIETKSTGKIGEDNTTPAIGAGPGITGGDEVAGIRGFSGTGPVSEMIKNGINPEEETHDPEKKSKKTKPKKKMTKVHKRSIMSAANIAGISDESIINFMTAEFGDLATLPDDAYPAILDAIKTQAEDIENNFATVSEDDTPNTPTEDGDGSMFPDSEKEVGYGE